jgi:hypothetical protein
MAYDGLTDVELSDDGLKPNFDSLKDFEDD